MRIRMLVQMPEGASRNGEPWPAEGEETELPTAEAAHLVDSGVAEEVVDQDEAAQQPTGPRGRRRKSAQPEGEAT